MNFFYSRYSKTPIITFTIGLLLFYRIMNAVMLSVSQGGNTPIAPYNINLLWLMPLIISFYFLGGLLATYFLSKINTEKLKEKFYKHPILTIIIVFLYTSDIPRRIVNYGGKPNFLDIFETIVYYGITSFLGGYLFTWIAEKVYKKNGHIGYGGQWGVDKGFLILPILYKILLGFEILMLIIGILVMIIIYGFHYTGFDLIKILK